MVGDTSFPHGLYLCQIWVLSTKWATSQLNNLEDIGQGQRSLCATRHLMLVITCVQCGTNPSRNVRDEERTPQDMPNFCSFIAKSWLNDLDDIGVGQRSLCSTHFLMLVIIFAKYGQKTIQNCKSYRADTACGKDGRTEGCRTGWNQYTPPPPPPPPSPQQQLCCARGIINTITVYLTNHL